MIMSQSQSTNKIGCTLRKPNTDNFLFLLEGFWFISPGCSYSILDQMHNVGKDIHWN